MASRWKLEEALLRIKYLTNKDRGRQHQCLPVLDSILPSVGSAVVDLDKVYVADTEKIGGARTLLLPQRKDERSDEQKP